MLWTQTSSSGKIWTEMGQFWKCRDGDEQCCKCTNREKGSFKEVWTEMSDLEKYGER